MHNTTKKRLLPGLGAAITALALTFSGAFAANAQTVPTPDSADVVITFTDAAPGSAGDGTEQTPGGTGIDGATFTAYELTDYDMATNDGQQAAADLSVAEAVDLAGGASAPSLDAQTTGVDGVATFATLSPGLYLFMETGTVPAERLPAAPFLVANPMTDPSGSGFLDTIFVYPKATTVESLAFTKTLDASDAVTIGDSVTWTISGAVPQVSELTEYRITDALAANLAITDVASDVTVTVAGTGDYERGVDYTVDYSSNNLEVAFTAAGRSELAASARAGATTVTVTVDTVIEAAGTIENTAVLHVNGGEINSTDPQDPTGPGATVLRVGEIDIVKTSNLEAADLEGAVFDLYTANPADGDVDALVTGLTTGADGTIATDLGIVLGSDGGETGRTFWLVETTALAGHQLLAAPVEVQVDFSADNWDATAAIYTTDEIVNLSSDSAGFTLPLTGGAGTLLLTVGGLVLLAVIVLFAVLRRRTQQADA